MMTTIMFGFASSAAATVESVNNNNSYRYNITTTRLQSATKNRINVTFSDYNMCVPYTLNASKH